MARCSDASSFIRDTWSSTPTVWDSTGSPVPWAVWSSITSRLSMRPAYLFTTTSGYSWVRVEA